MFMIGSGSCHEQPSFLEEQGHRHILEERRGCFRANSGTLF
jgi:hypothetical protein